MWITDLVQKVGSFWVIVWTWLVPIRQQSYVILYSCKWLILSRHLHCSQLGRSQWLNSRVEYMDVRFLCCIALRFARTMLKTDEGSRGPVSWLCMKFCRQQQPYCFGSAWCGFSVWNCHKGHVISWSKTPLWRHVFVSSLWRSCQWRHACWCWGAVAGAEKDEVGAQLHVDR